MPNDQTSFNISLVVQQTAIIEVWENVFEKEKFENTLRKKIKVSNLS